MFKSWGSQTVVRQDTTIKVNEETLKQYTAKFKDLKNDVMSLEAIKRDLELYISSRLESRIKDLDTREDELNKIKKDVEESRQILIDDIVRFEVRRNKDTDDINKKLNIMSEENLRLEANKAQLQHDYDISNGLMQNGKEIIKILDDKREMLNNDLIKIKEWENSIIERENIVNKKEAEYKSLLKNIETIKSSLEKDKNELNKERDALLSRAKELDNRETELINKETILNNKKSDIDIALNDLKTSRIKLDDLIARNKDIENKVRIAETKLRELNEKISNTIKKGVVI